MANTGDVTALLKAWSAGGGDALGELEMLVHHELRQMARRLLEGERAGHGWQATDLINESYLRLIGWRGVELQNRAHFYATAAQMMRRVLVDAARARQSAKRGAGAQTVSIESVQLPAPDADLEVIALEDALDELSAIVPRASQVVQLRFFGGFSVAETADALNVSVRTVINDWNTARAWLRRRLSTQGSDEQ
ncbi:MAG TPA: sigma-70 family RNA polymerase sigma factor [Vicinamibacterales bacterium]|nr:sigma-70 family RNA polymerase sigma factor [Vicinamibacterales bacterium]